MYAWYPYGGNSDTAHLLGAGTYSVIVSDANGCQGVASISPPLTQPEAISVIAIPNNVSCFGASNGSVNINVAGGTPPYTYLWSPGNYTIPNLIGLSAGTYQLTITDSHNCTETYFVNISEPASLTATISNIQHVSCYGGHNGSVTVVAQGGTPPYSFLWSPSGNTSQIASGLSAGTHTVYITDAKGCSYSLTVQINQPPILNAMVGYQSPTCNNANDGMAWVFASGGTSPYSYSWSPSGGANDTAYNIHAGIYMVTVTDQNSCQAISSVQIPQPTPVTATIRNYGNVSCFNGSNGYAVVSVTGGIPPYSYLWSTGSTLPSITNLTEGIYYVTVNDAKGCTSVDSVYIQSPNQPLNLTVTHQDVSCYQGNNGYALAQVNGGTPPYQYIWVPTIQFTAQANNLMAGTYTVSITDANGCQTMGNVTIAQPTPLLANAVVLNPALCYDTPTGSATVSVSGGSPPYSYSWNTIPSQTTQQATQIFAGEYRVTVTDVKGCTVVDSIFVTQPPALQSVIVNHTDVTCFGGNDGMALGGAIGGTPPYLFSWDTQPPVSLQQLSNITAGTYTLQVTDANNCTTTSQVTIVQPSQVITHAINDVAICLGDSIAISATASGGMAPYIFNWFPTLGFGSSHTVKPSITTSYIATAFDAKGCQGITDTITVHVFSLYPQDVSLTAGSPICPGNSSQILLTAHGESFDTLYYAWSNGLGPGVGPFTVVPQQPTWYRVTVTNTCDFSVVDSVFVDFAPSPVIQFSTDITQGCVPITVEFTDSSWTSFDDINYWEWHFGDGTTSTDVPVTHTYNQPGTYYAWLSVSTTTGCTANSENNPLPIYVFENPVAKFATNKEIYYLPNDPVICINQSTGAVAYWWNFNDGTTSQNVNPTHTYSHLGQYQIILIATNMYQCTDTAYKTIDVSGDIVFPNAFTPDQNGPNGGSYSMTDYTNHVFFPVSTGVSEFNMQIFNRWGELIFETNDISIGWDGYYKGNLCQEDVYVYQAKATFTDGRKVEKKGDVLLVR
jgi:gliding motility-associated-like protein